LLPVICGVSCKRKSILFTALAKKMRKLNVGLRMVSVDSAQSLQSEINRKFFGFLSPLAFSSGQKDHEIQSSSQNVASLIFCAIQQVRSIDGFWVSDTQ